MPEQVKPHLSPSALNSYFRCGEAYRRRYIEKQIIPPPFAMIKGGAVHVAQEENFKQKLESKADLSAKQIVDLAAASFEGKVRAEGVLLNAEQEAEGKTKVQGEYLDSTVKSAQVLAKIAAYYQPLAVEERVRLVLPGSPYDLLGILDLVDAQGVQDLKNTAKKKSQAEVDGDIQFTTYAALYRAKYGAAPGRIVIDNIVHRPGSKKDAEYQAITTRREVKDFDCLAARMNAAIKGIQAGIFTPATPGAWWCSAKSCGYSRTCPYFSGFKGE